MVMSTALRSEARKETRAMCLLLNLPKCLNRPVFTMGALSG